MVGFNLQNNNYRRSYAFASALFQTIFIVPLFDSIEIITDILYPCNLYIYMTYHTTRYFKHAQSLYTKDFYFHILLLH